MARLPSSVLFACTTNVVRSPMAEVILKSLHGSRIYVNSVGISTGESDPFATAAMLEIGLDLARHRSKSFDDLDDIAFDLLIALSPQAEGRVKELSRSMAMDVEVWPIPDPTSIWGTRDQRMAAYRGIRDELLRRIGQRFPPIAQQLR